MRKIVIHTDDLISVPQAARILSKPKVTLYRWIERGKMLSVELGGYLFVTKAEVERLKNGQPLT